MTKQANSQKTFVNIDSPKQLNSTKLKWIEIIFAVLLIFTSTLTYLILIFHLPSLGDSFSDMQNCLHPSVNKQKFYQYCIMMRGFTVLPAIVGAIWGVFVRARIGHKSQQDWEWKKFPTWLKWTIVAVFILAVISLGIAVIFAILLLAETGSPVFLSDADVLECRQRNEGYFNRIMGMSYLFPPFGLLGCLILAVVCYFLWNRIKKIEETVESQQPGLRIIPVSTSLPVDSPA